MMGVDVCAIDDESIAECEVYGDSISIYEEEGRLIVYPIGIFDAGKHEPNKLNTNAESCTPHFIQRAMVTAIEGDTSGPDYILRVLRERRDACIAGLNAIDGIDVATPDSTFYVFPNVTAIMQRKGLTDVNQLMTRALHQTGVSFCTRKHFGRVLPGESNDIFRVAYSGICVTDINKGMAKLKTYFESNVS